MSKTSTPPTVPTPSPTEPLEDGGPWEGVAAVVPGTIQAEEFDEGGEGVAYSDSSEGNNKGVRRSGELLCCRTGARCCSLRSYSPLPPVCLMIASWLPPGCLLALTLSREAKSHRQMLRSKEMRQPPSVQSVDLHVSGESHMPRSTFRLVAYLCRSKEPSLTPSLALR